MDVQFIFRLIGSAKNLLSDPAADGALSYKADSRVRRRAFPPIGPPCATRTYRKFKYDYLGSSLVLVLAVR